MIKTMASQWDEATRFSVNGSSLGVWKLLIRLICFAAFSMLGPYDLMTEAMLLGCVQSTLCTTIDLNEELIILGDYPIQPLQHQACATTTSPYHGGIQN